MDIAEKIKILEESKSLLDKVTTELKKRAYRKAETERNYRKASGRISNTCKIILL